MNSALTEAALFNLPGRQGKHRKQFNHDLDDDIGHHRSRRDSRIDLETLEEISQALEEIEQGIVARRDPTGSLLHLYFTGELFEDHR